MADLDALECLNRSLQALALPAADQISLFPAFVCVADELAEDYGWWLEVFLSGHHCEHETALRTLDGFLDAMSGSKNAALWTDEALRTDGHWTRIREMARGVLDDFGWPLELPDLSHIVYVPGGRDTPIPDRTVPPVGRTVSAAAAADRKFPVLREK